MRRFIFLLISFISLLSISCKASVDTTLPETSVPKEYSDIKISNDKKDVITEGDVFSLSISTTDNRNLNKITWTITPKDNLKIEKNDDTKKISLKALKKGQVTIKARESITNKENSISFDIKEKKIIDQNKPLTLSYDLNDFIFYNTTDNTLGLIDEFDRVFLKLERNNGNIEYYTLGRGGDIIWEMQDNGIDTTSIDYNNTKKVLAIYAPSYIWDENKNFIFKSGAKQLPGHYYSGKNEVLITEGIINEKSNTIHFNFNRDYAQLKIKVNPGQRLRVNITSFTSADTVINSNLPQNKYSQSILADSYIYLYGKWDSNSKIQIINQKYGKLNEVYIGTLPPYQQGETIQIDCTWTETPIKIEQSTLKVKHLPDSAFIRGKNFPGAIAQGQDHLCWAASLSQIISWWMLNNEKNNYLFTPIKEGSGFENKDYNTRSRYIYDNVFKTNFDDKGYTVDFGLKWFLDGTMNGSIKSMLRNPEVATGGYFSNVENISDLAWNMWENYNYPNYENNKEMAMLRFQEISKEIYGNLLNGQPIILVDGYEDINGKPEEHAFVLWQADFDVDKQIVTSIKVSDSNGGYVLPEQIPFMLGTVKVQFYDDPNIKNNSIFLNLFNPDNPETVYGSTNSLEYLYALFPDFNNIKYITE